MSVQSPERLLYKGQVHGMCTEPLADYIKQMEFGPGFSFVHSGLTRRYVGSWEIIEDHLYLTGLDAQCLDGPRATLATIFPGADKVLASWYSGALRVPQDVTLNCVHMHYVSDIAPDMLLEIKAGVVVATKFRHPETGF